MANCINCEEEYSNKRKALGYSTCLCCGEETAMEIKAVRTKAMLEELTPYLSGSMTQPDALFDQRGGDNSKHYAKKA
jgi:hypothetical protein